MPVNLEQEAALTLSDDAILSLLSNAFEASNLPLPERNAGKVRDWYSLPDQRRLIVTTDRLSAFDRNLAVVPYKGQVLNQLSAWWFEQTTGLIGNHILSIPDPNAAVVKEVTPFPIEVIVRGYITGVTSTALWHRYSLGERSIYGYTFGEGLKKNQVLPEPIITPTTKGGVTGHDERLTCLEVVEKGYLNKSDWDQIQSAALSIFKLGQQIAEQADMILVDTKYEFGRSTDGQILLIDEVHTPDSSRFWKKDTYAERFAAGEEPENFDKEFIRIYYADRGYRGDGQPPVVEPELWLQASRRYIAIYEKLTGREFLPGNYPVNPRLIENLRKGGYIQ
ncbi:phosphoribosylaminoimidazolesuccinocarboxamide synthase [Leptolinea tardivitalis]|uniref:Phosphoribosylaminoimidazole-succinocarboxamide synthase n=1 Tax=Leptolinea tardivitalis TaxID=229920 RepID=A0A0N8GL05_9CHLR|nr:phosphoribosylaminoimidazolesuccinocarboxamide synthase [Leptolinea tardivitalis]KPL71154.1 phosphoribosylaminoimidazole-succinocarboxamide synthase [Leptolinea tardivitalis]GAP22591.1 phosphoribosylaminoimidazolesuccinocarboxamide (SAICAR) synthase [Leptolinea tardivitalis]